MDSEMKHANIHRLTRLPHYAFILHSFKDGIKASQYRHVQCHGNLAELKPMAMRQVTVNTITVTRTS